jgi:Phage tail tube protein
MPTQSRANVTTAYRIQTAHGALPANDATARVFPTYESPGFRISKTPIPNLTIRPTMDRLRPRHGLVSVEGQASGALCLGTYDPLFEAALRGTWSAVLTSASFTASYVASTGVLTRGTGSFVGEGFKIGDTVYLAGANVAAQANIPLVLVAVGTTTCTVGNNLAIPGNTFIPITDIASAASTTLVRPKKLIQATTPVLREFAFEHWEPAITNSERYIDCRLDTMTLGMPLGENNNVAFGFRGTNMLPATSQYFTSAVQSTATAMSSSDMVVVYNGASSVTISAAQLSVNLNTDAPNVLGTTIAPNVIDGVMDVVGSLTFQRDTRTNLAAFLAETGPWAMTFLSREVGTNGFISASLPAFTLGDAQPGNRIGASGVQEETVELLLGIGTGADRDPSMITMCTSAA